MTEATSRALAFALSYQPKIPASTMEHSAVIIYATVDRKSTKYIGRDVGAQKV